MEEELKRILAIALKHHVTDIHLNLMEDDRLRIEFPIESADAEVFEESQLLPDIVCRVAVDQDRLITVCFIKANALIGRSVEQDIPLPLAGRRPKRQERRC